MSEAQPGNSKPYDPLEPFRGMRNAYLDAMAKTMVETVNSEAYAQASGAMLDNSLTMSAPFREAIEKSMLQVLQQLSLPSRQDILGLAERFTNLEMRLDDMDACLDGFESTVQKSMLPMLKQLLLLTERFTNLNTRLEVIDANLDRLQKLSDVGGPVAKNSPAGQTGTKLETQSATHAPLKARKTRKPAQPAKQAPPTKRTVRKRAR